MCPVTHDHTTFVASRQAVPTFGAAYRAYTEHVQAIPKPTPAQRVERVQLRKALRQAAISAWQGRRG